MEKCSERPKGVIKIMTRKLIDYMSELSSYLERNGGTVLECSHCGHAVAVVGWDVKTFCEYTITCAECKKEKPLIDTPIQPDPFYWQKYNNPPITTPCTDKPSPVWTGDGPNTMSWSGEGYPPVTVINNMDGGGVQGISASNPDIQIDWHILTNEPWDKYCTCGVKFDIISEHVSGCGFLIEKERLIKLREVADNFGIH